MHLSRSLSMLSRRTRCEFYHTYLETALALSRALCAGLVDVAFGVGTRSSSEEGMSKMSIF
jgi:hypothetical protein